MAVSTRKGMPACHTHGARQLRGRASGPPWAAHRGAAMPAARAGRARKKGPDEKQERAAEERAFPDLIPYNAGPPS
eukprot:3498003-Lingulodinium_polyedra.AAC.1